MTRTRSQTGNIAIKKEEEEEDRKPMLGANNVPMTTRSKITKQKSTIHKSNLPAQQIKMEEDTNTKSVLQSGSKPSNSASRPRVSQEQINQLVHYIVNDNMNITKATRKANISRSTGFIYYNTYKNDPEKKIPVPRDQRINHPTIYTQEQVGNLIRYIDTDKMTVAEASVKVNFNYDSASYYYNRYLKDPNHNIPIPQLKQCYTQEQRDGLISYIINDKMSIVAASKKAKMKISTAQSYYHNYFKVQNPDIATPSHIATHKCYTQKQIKQVIRYIVNDKMSITAASRKAKMGLTTGHRFYHRYLNNDATLFDGMR
jgi:transposase